MENSKLPAFPIDGNSTGHPSVTGLTKREYFAGIAMQGILANEIIMKAGIDIHIKGERELSAHVTGMAIEYADALLTQLEKK